LFLLSFLISVCLCVLHGTFQGVADVVVSPRAWEAESIVALVFARGDAESLVRKVVLLKRKLMEARQA
jgi:hypothetical protein